MTVKQQELLSAFIDGELKADELDSLMAMLDDNEEMKADLLRYQFTSDFIHGYTKARQFDDLSLAVSAAIADDELPAVALADTGRSRVIRMPDWFWKQTAGFAAAASIGALAVVGVMNNSQTDAVSPVQVAQTEVQAKESPNRWTVGEAEVEDRLNDYLVEHNEYAGASGLFTYARVVSYSDE